jgi:hypothetical protein
MNEILSTRSVKHGERKWNHVGEREHVTSDGRRVTLKVWRGACVKCGAQYDVAATAGPQSRAFGVVHCRAHRGKAPHRPSRTRGIKLSIDSLIGCRLLAAHFDFEAHQARLMLAPGHCTDMMGAIEFCRGVDPDVTAIATFSGDKLDTRYRKGDNGWQAYGPPRAVSGVH